MPEPVIIEPAASAAEANDDEIESQEPQDPPTRGKGKISALFVAFASVGTKLFRLLARAFRLGVKGGIGIFKRYPRHSLTAVVSILILGAVWYSQISGGRGPVTNQIKGDSAAGVSKDAKNPNTPKADGSPAAPVQPATASSGKSGAAKPDDPQTARNDASPSTASVAPAPTMAHDPGADPPLPALAGAPADAKEPAPAPGKESTPADLADSGKPAPTSSPALSPSDSTPTLLPGSLPEPAPQPSAPVASGDKGNADALKPVPTTESPAAVAVAPAPSAPGEPVPLPAPTSDALELATKLEPAGTQNQTPPTSAANAPVSKPNDAPAPAATKSAPKTDDVSQPDPKRDIGPAPSASESTKTEQIKSEPPKSNPPNDPEPVSAPTGPAPDTKEPAAPLSSLELATPGGDARGPAKPPSEELAPAVGASNPGGENAVSRPAMPGSASAATAATVEATKPTASTAEVDARTKRPQDATPSRSRASQDQESDGWVSVPNSGKLLPTEGVQDADGASGRAGTALESGTAATRDARAHAAKDASFELESPRSRGTTDLQANAGRAAAGAGTALEARSRTSAGRVESVPHVVERNENFWTISRLYYSSGRYYRALWKANAESYPDIKKLKINDVINIPPVEDLDPAYIDPPRSRAPLDQSADQRPSGSLDRRAPRDEEVAERSVSSAVAPQGMTEGVPVRRSSRSDPDLDLPPPDAVSRQRPAPDRTGRRADRPIGDEDAAREEPASRTAARPNATGRRPVYKIRPYDTLRSIARDMLGDSHRSSEILNLNRDLIDDPSHLIVGQMLQLPDDARTGLRR